MRKKNYSPPVDDYAEIEEVSDKKIISVEGFGEEEAANLTPILQKFMTAYDENKIVENLQEEFSDKSPDEIQKLQTEIQSNVSKWNESIKDLNVSCAEGSTVEEWLTRKLNESAIGVNAQDYENYLSNVLELLHKENFSTLKNLDFAKNFGKADDFINAPSAVIPEQIGREVQIGNWTGMILNNGLNLLEKFLPADKIKEVQSVANALRGGDDTGVKNAATAALTVAVEKGKIPILPKNTPLETIAGIACFGVEQTKIMLRFADGEISSTQALTLMGRAAVVNASFVMGQLGEKIGRQVGQKVGMAVGTIIPALAPVGAVLGGYIGAAVGKIGGSAIGKTIGKAAEKLSKAAEPLILRTCNAIKTAKRIFEGGIKKLMSIFD